MDPAKIGKDCYTRLYERLKSHPANNARCIIVNNMKRRRVFCVLLAVMLVWYWCVLRDHNAVSFNLNSECSIPDIDPYDPSIRQYIFHPEPLGCNTTGDLVYVDRAGVVTLNESRMAAIGGVTCEYRVVIRNEGDDDHVTLGRATHFRSGDVIKADFFKMTCKDKRGYIIANKFMSHIYTNSSIKDQIREKAKKSTTTPPMTQYSVLLVLFDSLSRLNGLRKLKKTYRFMTETIGGYDFTKYTKIGDNTFPNVVPMLTGKLPSELHDRTEFVDDYPFIWKDFRKAGYASMFAEDLPKFATLNWNAKGLRNPPVDHYMRPFWLSMAADKISDGDLSPLWLALENKRIHIGKSSTMCYGSTAKHALLMDYTADFMSKYIGMPRFAFNLIGQICHDHMNQVELGDEDFYNSLRDLHQRGVFEDTFVLVFGDHGPRFDAIRSTLIGRMEERLPMMLFSIPTKFKAENRHIDAILRTNTRRLVTLHDVHQTLQDILHGTFDSRSRNVRVRNSEHRGISLFQPIPQSRSCKSAFIPDNYCACYQTTEKNTTSPEIKTIADVMIRRLNDLVSKEKSCAKLTMTSIKSAQEVLQMSNLIGSKTWFFGWSSAPDLRQYNVVIETAPSKALFEATVNYGTSSAEIIGDISRINRYGNQSACVKDKFLRLYCYCVV